MYELFYPDGRKSALSARNAELAALYALRKSIGLRVLGCTIERGLTAGMTVAFEGEPIGVWWHHDGLYNFAPTSRAAAVHQAETVDDLVDKTVALLAAHMSRMGEPTRYDDDAPRD